MDATPIRTLSRETAFSCPPFFDVVTDRVELPDGTRMPFSFVHFSGCVYVVPVLEDGRIALIRQYRHTVERWCWELPAGGIRRGHTPDGAAAAELKEEIGGTAARWHKLGVFHLSNGTTDETGHFFLAEGVTLGATEREPTEFLEVHPVEQDKAFHMIMTGEMMDGPSSLALLLWSRREEIVH